MDKIKQGGTTTFFNQMRQLIVTERPNFGNGDSPLSLLYEVYNELNSMDTDQIQADFETLYQAMNGMILNEMDAVITPRLRPLPSPRMCRVHRGREGGMRMKEELEG